MAYAYVWEYIISPDKAGLFERTYGPAGEWVALFRQANGYLRTELLRDRSDPTRFLTIDHWESEEAWRAFRTRFANEYQKLDARCGDLTTHEEQLGSFDVVS